MGETKSPPELKVSFIDREHRAVCMEYDDCPISLSFSKEPNSGIRDAIKEILIGAMVNNSGDLSNCINTQDVR